MLNSSEAVIQPCFITLKCPSQIGEDALQNKIYLMHFILIRKNNFIRCNQKTSKYIKIWVHYLSSFELDIVQVLVPASVNNACNFVLKKNLQGDQPAFFFITMKCQLRKRECFPKADCKKKKKKKKKSVRNMFPNICYKNRLMTRKDRWTWKR